LDHWATRPWRSFCRGLLVTLLVGLAASFLTRKKVFWRT
jgi:hypothetical protein